MSSDNPVVQSVDWRMLVQLAEGGVPDAEPDYEFSNGRRFYQPEAYPQKPDEDPEE